MPEDVNIRKIEQGRAEAAYDFVSEAKAHLATSKDNKAGNYKSNVKKNADIDKNQWIRTKLGLH